MAALIHVLLTLFGLLLSCDASRTTVKTYITVGNEKQIMTSPNYPKPYGNVLTYEWYLTANASIPYGVVNFKVIDCRIRDATPCYEEAIIIYNVCYRAERMVPGIGLLVRIYVPPGNSHGYTPVFPRGVHCQRQTSLQSWLQDRVLGKVQTSEIDKACCVNLGSLHSVWNIRGRGYFTSRVHFS
ncbi:uncharacterized protein LOC110457423 isoform X2 [Mizuhopecten yessoensis]|uniref:uncharacterized protein LOC110457423 isoform X2 n=1 Tax=Mizuhopecten yessoensis TaxID=6573 RepID=UPI000B45BA9F|nr:uncharacterized protein LOC110457423 isoform X2 [Mizuhopecten yessoensis]